MSVKVNSSLRFPESRRLLTEIDSFLINPKVRKEVKEHSLDCTSSEFLETSNHPQECFQPIHELVPSDSDLTWSRKTQKIKGALRKQIKAYKQSIVLNERRLRRQQVIMRKLLQYAKISPLLAAEAISSNSAGMNQWIAKEKLKCVAVVDKEKTCNSIALPYSRFCLEHILLDDKQVLYKQCVATDTTTTKQCGRPVLEILQDKPYCRLHTRLVLHSNELKKNSSKLAVPTVKGVSGRRKGVGSPSRTKKNKALSSSAESKLPNKPPNPLSLSLMPPGEPLLTQASAPPPHPHHHSGPGGVGGAWNTTTTPDSDMDMKKPPHHQPSSVEMVGDTNLLHVPITPTLNNDMSLTFGHNDSKNDSLLPFSPDAVNTFPCPPLPPAPQVGLFPFDSALIGNILDNSSDED